MNLRAFFAGTALSVRFANPLGHPSCYGRLRRTVFKDRFEAGAPQFAALVSISGPPASTQPLACISHHLTTEARDKTDSTSLRLIAVLNVQSSTSARVNLRTPRTDGLLTHFASPRGGQYRLRTRIEREGPWVRRALDRSLAVTARLSPKNGPVEGRSRKRQLVVSSKIRTGWFGKSVLTDLAWRVAWGVKFLGGFWG